MSLLNISSEGQNPAEFIAKFPHNIVFDPHSTIALKTGFISMPTTEHIIVDDSNNRILIT